MKIALATKPDPALLALEEEILVRRPDRVRLQIADAKALAKIEAARHHETAHQCASIREYGERVLSLSGREAAEGAALGRALALFPGLEALVLFGKTSAGTAAVLADLGKHPEAIRPGDDWLAETAESTGTLRKKVAERLREVQETPVQHTVTLELSDQAMADMERTRTLASSKEKEPLTRSRAVEVALRHYVHEKDLLERTPGKRRMAPTDDPLSPKSRALPAEVNRGVWGRAKGKCRHRYCEHTLFLERIHEFVRHADGGSRELSNMCLRCKKHHRMQERGEIRNLGTTTDPRFVDAAGRSMDERRLAKGPPP
jgi:hypothetical protein